MGDEVQSDRSGVVCRIVRSSARVLVNPDIGIRLLLRARVRRVLTIILPMLVPPVWIILGVIEDPEAWFPEWRSRWGQGIGLAFQIAAAMASAVALTEMYALVVAGFLWRTGRAASRRAVGLVLAVSLVVTTFYQLFFIGLGMLDGVLIGLNLVAPDIEKMPLSYRPLFSFSIGLLYAVRMLSAAVNVGPLRALVALVSPPLLLISPLLLLVWWLRS